MEYFFSKFVLETTDALGMEGVAAIRGARTVPDDAASPKAFARVAEFIDGRQIDHVEFLHRRRGDFGARELRGAILYDTSSSEPEPCLHVLNALLGYQGSGPLLSKLIMKHLGMSEGMFDQMNRSVNDIHSTNKSYAISAGNLDVDWLYDTSVPLILYKR